MVQTVVAGIQEQPFQIDLENIPAISHKRPRRCRRTLPARCEKLQLDLDAAFFSSTQILQSDSGSKSAQAPLGLRRAGVKRQSIQTFKRSTQSRVLVESATCLSSPNAPAIAPADPHPVRVAYQCKGAHSLPDRRCSRELQSLGIARNQNLMNKPSPSVPAPYTADALAVNTCCGTEHKALADAVLRHDSHSTMRALRGNARTRARAPALSFMLARANMQLPIMKEDTERARRTGEPLSDRHVIFQTSDAPP